MELKREDSSSIMGKEMILTIFMQAMLMQLKITTQLIQK